MSPLVVATVLVAALTGAGQGPSAGKGRIVVDFTSEEPAEAWFAAALEQRLLAELARFQRVTLVDKLPAPECSTRDPRCLVTAYAQHAEVVVLGSLRGDRLRYEVHETWTRSMAAAGTLDVGQSVSGGRLQHQMGSIVRPIVQSGGLIDELSARELEVTSTSSSTASDAGTTAVVPPAPTRLPPRGKRRGTPPPSLVTTPPPEPAADPRLDPMLAPLVDPGVPLPETTPTPPVPPSPAAQEALDAPAKVSPPAPREDSSTRLIVVGGMAGLAILPLLVGLYLAGGGRGVRKRGGGALLIFVLALVLAVAAAFADWRNPAGPLRPYVEHPAAGLVFSVLGGMLWATFLLLNLAIALPPMHGIGRIRPDALWWLTRSWLATAAMRSSLLLVYLPLGILVLAVGRWFALSGRTLWMVVIPATGLLASFWFLALVQLMAAFLDRSLVNGAASAGNPWHHAVRRYLRGYLRRTGADVSPELLSRIMFLPGRGEGVGSYGGGLTAPRILIGTRLLELALGPPEEPAAPDQRIDLDALPLGAVLPDARGGKHGRAQERARLRSGGPGARGVSGAAAGGLHAPKSHANRRLGEAATLLGWVIPATRDETVPLISNTQEDYEVVHSLLTEHYAAFEKDVYEEDDDTDPRHKDFLFGAIMREIGAIRRRDTLLETLRLSYLRLSSGLGPFKRVNDAVADVLLRFFSRAPAAVSDSYVALNSGGDHLIQYYGYLRRQDEDALTARADAPRLYRASRDVFDRLRNEQPGGHDRQVFRATLRNRLVSLSRFFSSRIPEEHARSFKLTATLLALSALGILVAGWVSTSLDYHPIYLERMQQLRERLTEQNAGGADAGTH